MQNLVPGGVPVNFGMSETADTENMKAEKEEKGDA